MCMCRDIPDEDKKSEILQKIYTHGYCFKGKEDIEKLTIHTKFMDLLQRVYFLLVDTGGTYQGLKSTGIHAVSKYQNSFMRRPQQLVKSCFNNSRAGERTASSLSSSLLYLLFFFFLFFPYFDLLLLLSSCASSMPLSTCPSRVFVLFYS